MYNIIYIVGGIAMFFLGVLLVASLLPEGMVFGVFFFAASIFFVALGIAAQARGIRQEKKKYRVWRDAPEPE